MANAQLDIWPTFLDHTRYRHVSLDSIQTVMNCALLVNVNFALMLALRVSTSVIKHKMDSYDISFVFAIVHLHVFMCVCV